MHEDSYNESNRSESNRIDALEMRFTYLEDFVKQLQEEVVAQSKTIEKLYMENAALREKIKELSELEGDVPNRKPPHY